MILKLTETSLRFLQGIRHQVSQLQHLVSVKPGVALSQVTCAQVRISYCVGTSGTFSYMLSSHFEVYTTGITAFCLVYLEKLLQFTHDVIELASFISTGCLYRIAVHWVG